MSGKLHLICMKTEGCLLFLTIDTVRSRDCHNKINQPFPSKQRTEGTGTATIK